MFTYTDLLAGCFADLRSGAVHGDDRLAYRTLPDSRQPWRIEGSSSARLKPEDVTVGEVPQKGDYFRMRPPWWSKWGLGDEGNAGIPNLVKVLTTSSAISIKIASARQLLPPFPLGGIEIELLILKS